MSILSKLHVIAISKKLNKSKELDVYVFFENNIYLYSPQWELEIKWNYSEKIREIASHVDKDILEWVDFNIQDGQDIIRKGKSIFVDNEVVQTFSRLSQDDFANIGPITTKIYNEFIKSRQKGDEAIKDFLRETFEEGFFSTQVANLIENMFDRVIEVDDLNNLDKQIIVRSKTEGYKFIVDFMKNILRGSSDKKIEYCEIFLGRVFMLESQNFVKF